MKKKSVVGWTLKTLSIDDILFKDVDKNYSDGIFIDDRIWLTNKEANEYVNTTGRNRKIKITIEEVK